MSAVRGSSLRAQLSRTLVGLGLVSVVLLACVNFFVVRSLLDTEVRSQLVTLRDLRRDAIEAGVDRLLAEVSVLADDPAVGAAVLDLDTAYSTIDTDLDAAQMDELSAAYVDVVGRYDEAGAQHPPIDELIPTSAAGRYVQYQYIAANPNPPDQRADLVDAGDGSDFSAAHAEYHPFLRSLRDNLGATDLLLVGAGSRDVVYSTSKRVDLGTDVTTGPHLETGLGVSLSQLASVGINDAVMADSAFYLPDSSAPVVHVAAAVRSNAAVVGAIVIAIPIATLTALVTANQQFDLLGLGDTGEAYVVGPDLRLRTVPRAWFEDPDGYLRRFAEQDGDERVAQLIEFTGSPVLLQPVDNDAVTSALDGEQFTGVVDNYLGRRTLASAAPLNLPGLDWVIVTEQQTSETNDELQRFVRSIGLLLAILLPILAIVGLYLARALARPVGPLVNAARQIADGDFDTEVPDLGRNELGDLGGQLNAVTVNLRDQERAIEQEEQRIASMLESVLPPALVERIRRGERNVADQVDIGTAISLDIHGLPQSAGVDQDTVLEITSRLASQLGAVSLEHGVERIRVASDQQLFVAGRGQPGAGTAAALAFAESAIAVVDSVGLEFGIELVGHIGLSVGQVATGVLGSQQVSFAMWGECVGKAVELSATTGGAEIRADRSVVGELDAQWTASPLDTQSVDMAGSAIEAFVIRPAAVDVTE